MPCKNVSRCATSAPKIATASAPPSWRLVLSTPLAVPARQFCCLGSRCGCATRRPRCARPAPATKTTAGAFSTRWPKGNSCALTREVFFGQQGLFRERVYLSQLNRATCISLIIDAIVIWNTRYMMAALDRFRHSSFPVHDDDLKHITPLI
jgi:hypothetical protein